MADNVRSLEAARPTVDDELVAKLEATLERARAGKIHSVAVSELLDDRCIATWWHKPNNASLLNLIGGVTFLRHRLLQWFDQ